MTNEINTLTTYIAAWGWQLLSFICLSTGTILIMSTGNSTGGIVFGIAFILCFAGCQYMSLKRKKEVYDA